MRAWRNGEARRTSRLALAGGLCVLLIAVFPWGGQAAPPACETSWVSAASGLWETAGNWSNGVPDATKVACIKVNGTYTVTLRGSRSAEALDLGGASGTQTVELKGTVSQGVGSLVLPANGLASEIRSNGRLELNSEAGGSYAWLDILSSATPHTLTNGGVIDVNPGGHAQRYIYGDVVNNGTMSFDADLTNTTGGTDWTNNGSITVASGVTVNENGGGVFTQSGSSIAVSGSGVYRKSFGTFAFSGGTATGTVELVSVIVQPSGGSGTFVLLGGSNTLASDIGSGITLKVTGRSAYGHAVLTSSSARTNDGVIELNSDDANNYAWLNQSTSVALTNDNLIDVNLGGDDERYIYGDIVNNGTMSFDASLTATNGGSDWTNNGSITVADGVTVFDNGGGVFTQTGSSIAVSGSGVYRKQAGTFALSGGTVTGTAELQHGVDVQASGGSGTFVLLGSNTLGSDVGSGITLKLTGRTFVGHSTLTSTSPRTNAGRIELNSEDVNNYAWLNGSTVAALTNTGTIQINPGGDDERYIYGDIVNAAGGLVDVDYAYEFLTNASDWTNNGTIDVASGVTFTLGPAVLSNQSGSTLTGGKYVLSGTFKYSNADVDTLNGHLVLRPGGAVVNSTNVDALINMALVDAAGELELAAGRSFDPSPATVEIKGVLSGDGTLVSNVNNSSGTVAPGSSPATLSITGSFTQGKTASLEVELDGTGAGQFDRLLVSGAATFGGELAIDTNYTPAVGNTFQIMTQASKAKNFKPITGQFMTNPVDTGWQLTVKPTFVELKLVDTTNLKTVKNDSADPVTVNQAFDYVITVENLSSKTATQAKLVDSLKAPVVLNGTPTTSHGSCSVAGAKVTCNLGNLGSGVTATVSIPVKATSAGPAKNTANATSKLLDSAAGNNKDSENTAVNP